MDITLLLESFFGLIVLLALLMLVLFYKPFKPSKSNKKKKRVVDSPKKKESDFIALEKILEIVKNRKSTNKELEDTLNLAIKHHGTIHPKLGTRTHPDFDIYGEILLRICRHPNTSKEIILNFDRELEARNEDYKKDINDFLSKGLNSRGV
ncbi:MAG: hypothetical protein U9N39_02530 [Campylobacterota bacterium]|nr:hypothetical protein [Campylobacterota bacterium]